MGKPNCTAFSQKGFIFKSIDGCKIAKKAILRGTNNALKSVHRRVGLLSRMLKIFLVDTYFFSGSFPNMRSKRSGI